MNPPDQQPTVSPPQTDSKAATIHTASNSPNYNSIMVGIIIFFLLISGGLALYMITIRKTTTYVTTTTAATETVITSPPLAQPTIPPSLPQDEIESIVIDTSTTDFDALQDDLANL